MQDFPLPHEPSVVGVCPAGTLGLGPLLDVLEGGMTTDEEADEETAGVEVGTNEDDEGTADVDEGGAIEDEGGAGDDDAREDEETTPPQFPNRGLHPEPQKARAFPQYQYWEQHDP